MSVFASTSEDFVGNPNNKQFIVGETEANKIELNAKYKTMLFTRNDSSVTSYAGHQIKLMAKYKGDTTETQLIIKRLVDNFSAGEQEYRNISVSEVTFLDKEIEYIKVIFKFTSSAQYLSKDIPNFTLTFKDKVVVLPTEPFKLISKNADIENNKYKFIFNKDFTVNASDIEFKDSDGNTVAFTHSVSNKELIISPDSTLGKGNYTVKVNKVTSIENDELTDIPPMTIIIYSNFYLTGKDFSNFISTDTKELNLAFNKDITINSISVGSLAITSSVDSNKLKITLSALEDEKDYPITLNVKSIDNETLELTYNVSTKSITGNKDLDNLLYPILNLFEDGKNKGVIIIISATGVGVIFLTSTWLWKAAKGWLKTI